MSADTYISIMKDSTKKVIEVSAKHDMLYNLDLRVMWLTQGIVEAAKCDNSISTADFISLLDMQKRLVHVVEEWLKGDLDSEEEY